MSSNPSTSIEAIHAVTSIASGGSVGANAYQQWLEQQEEQQQLDSQSSTSSAASNPSAFSTSSTPGAYGTSGSSIGTDPIEKDFDFTPQQAHQFVENVMNTITSQIKQDGSDMAQAIQKIGSDDPNTGIFN